MQKLNGVIPSCVCGVRGFIPSRVHGALVIPHAIVDIYVVEGFYPLSCHYYGCGGNVKRVTIIMRAAAGTVLEDAASRKCQRA